MGHELASALWDGQEDGENLGLGMAYQPNDFVNPNQRGVELPPGCKDLMDVLKSGGSVRHPAGRQAIWRGYLRDVEQRVEAFLGSGVAEWLFSVGNPKRSIMAMLLKRPEGLILNFSVPVRQQSAKEVIRRIFQDPKVKGEIDGVEYFSVALNPAEESVAKMIVELLAEGFGVLEAEKLIFHSYEKAGSMTE